MAGSTGYSPLPAGPSGAFSGVWGWSFAMMEDSDVKEATWAMIAYLTSEGLQSDYLANGGIVLADCAPDQAARTHQVRGLAK